MVWSLSRRYGSGREAFPEFRKAHPEVREPLLTTPRPPLGVVRRPSERSRSGRESLPEVLEWSRGPPGGPGVVCRLFRRSMCGREAHPEVLEWSRVSPGDPGVVRRPTRR